MELLVKSTGSGASRLSFSATKGRALRAPLPFVSQRSQVLLGSLHHLEQLMSQMASAVSQATELVWRPDLALPFWHRLHSLRRVLLHALAFRPRAGNPDARPSRLYLRSKVCRHAGFHHRLPIFPVRSIVIAIRNRKPIAKTFG